MKAIADCKKDFPILQQQVNGRPLVYLDSAATAQRPAAVLEAVDRFYRTSAANPHRGVYYLAEAATAAYEGARQTVAAFAGAGAPEEIVFTRGATEGLNLLAYTLAPLVLRSGDSIVLPISEHHSNLVPWQRAAEASGAELRYLYLDDAGHYTDGEIEQKITDDTKIVAFAQVSNVLGQRLPVQKLVARAQQVGAVTVMDCAQSVPHMPLRLRDEGVDFAVFSAHKLYGPMGIGVLYGKSEWLEKLPPFLSGGDMIEYVEEQRATYAQAPQKFEAGTQNVGGAVGLAAAIEYLGQYDWTEIQAHEEALLRRAMEGLAGLPYVRILGDTNPANKRCGVVSFVMQDVHPHDVASILDANGVAIRAGHHCAQPLMRHLGVNASCRMSVGMYNDERDVDAFLKSLPQARRWLGYAG